VINLVKRVPHGSGQQPLLNQEQLEILQQLVAGNNDATLEELCELLEAKIQVRVSRATMGRIVQRLNMTRKNFPCDGTRY
jgi:transposase